MDLGTGNLRTRSLSMLNIGLRVLAVDIAAVMTVGTLAASGVVWRVVGV